jgi:uncharacterized protein YidB (DUF937 family)
MTDVRKLATLLDNPEVRDLLFGLAHTQKAEPAARMRSIVLDLAVTTTAEQYRSWLDDDERNAAMTPEQVRLTIGDEAIGDVADFVSSTPEAVAWQLAEVLPDLVDAISPGGRVIEAELIAREIAEATLEDDEETGAFA